MKLRVVGWTCYDFYDFESGENSWAVHMAVVDEIKKHGYLFSGEDHQERLNCCPVFNDGKMRRFSQRGFAHLMAEAHGETDYMAYAGYMFGIKLDACKFPKNSARVGDFDVETDLNETFTLQVDEQLFANAPIVETKTFFGTTTTKTAIKLDDLDELRYVDAGDTLVLTCNGKTKSFTIVDVDRDRDLTEEEYLEFMTKVHYNFDEQTREPARKAYEARPIVLTLTVKSK